MSNIFTLESDTLWIESKPYFKPLGYKVVTGIPGRCLLSEKEFSYYRETGKLLQEKDDEITLVKKDF